MMRTLLVFLLALAPVAVSAQDAEPAEEEDGCFGTSDSPQKFAFRMACYAGACVGFSYFYVAPACRSARDAQREVTVDPERPRRGVGLATDELATDGPDPGFASPLLVADRLRQL